MKFFILFKAVRRVKNIIGNILSKCYCHLVLYGNNVKHEGFSTNGCPYISVAIGGSLRIGKGLRMNNGIAGNPIGCFDRCTFVVDRGAKLEIGENLGISQAAIICHNSIQIGNNVKIGGGARIYDTDFHSLDPVLRSSAATDFKNKLSKPVILGDNVFIGAYSIILKGVEIGDNSVIGAGSIVTQSIPPNQIWAGNPARFIRQLN